MSRHIQTNVQDRCRAGCLAVVGTLLLTSSLAAQGFDAADAQPKKWTAQPTTLDSPTDTSSTIPAAVDQGFPSLLADDSLGKENAGRQTGGPSIAGPAVTVTSSLAVVLGLFAALVWMTRKFGSKGIHRGALPGEVLQSLGSTSIDPRTSVSMLRCGNRIVVFAQSATGVYPLTEITDAEEVRRLTASCLGESTQSFASTLKSIEQEPAADGFVGGQPKKVPQKRSRLFAQVG